MDNDFTYGKARKIDALLRYLDRLIALDGEVVDVSGEIIECVDAIRAELRLGTPRTSVEALGYSAETTAQVAEQIRKCYE